MMHWRVPETPAVDLSHAFDQLSFVVLTHNHADHLDFDLLNFLRNLPIQWIIPEFILPQVLAKVTLPEHQIVVPQPHQPIEIYGVRILPMEGHHFEESQDDGGTPRGVFSMAYLVEFNEKRWFFPGDTRDYHSLFLPSPDSLDGMFSHLWLGRGCAMMEDPPLLDEFCRFCISLKPKRIVLTHLEEFGRDDNDLWDLWHVQKVLIRLTHFGLSIPVLAARMGDRVIL